MIKIFLPLIESVVEINREILYWRLLDLIYLLRVKLNLSLVVYHCYNYTIL